MEFNSMMQGDTMGDAIGQITEIRLQCGASPDFKPAVVAIIETYDGWQPQLWTYQISSNPMAGLPPMFTSGPTPLSVMSKLSGSGQVQQWYQLLDEELTIANRPEEDAEAVKVDMRNELNGVSETGSGAPVGREACPDASSKNDSQARRTIPESLTVSETSQKFRLERCRPAGCFHIRSDDRL